jgi:DNA-directed RNA polymerase subunit beta'
MIVIDARRSEAEIAAALAAPLEEPLDMAEEAGLVDTIESRGE